MKEITRMFWSGKRTCLILFALVLPFSRCETLAAQEDPSSLQRGRIVERTGEHGLYHLYLPSKQPNRILVIAHGSPGKEEDTSALSLKFIKRWTKYAKRRNLLLIAPAFDRENFGSDPNTGFGYGGYRGLFGREIGADDFVIELVNQFENLCKVQDGRFLLYGHSAGGQFAVRFSVRHPSRVAAMVASAPGRFSYPSMEAKWPYGMGMFERNIQWDKQTRVQVAVNPDQNGWRAASSLPIAIVYGESDTERQPNRPAHAGNTRISFAKGWIDEMNKLRPEGVEPSIGLTLVKDIGHNSSKLTVPCQKAMSKLQWVEPTPLQKFRTWKSSNGQFTVKAIFVDQTKEEVNLRKVDGSQFSVPKAKLSAEDQLLLLLRPQGMGLG